MARRSISIMLVTLVLSVVATSQHIKSRHAQAEIKTADLPTEGLRDVKGTAARKKLLTEKLHDIYGEGDYEIQELKMNTEQGEIAAGVEVYRTTEEIAVDTTPCGKKKTVVRFHKEYTREQVSDTTCNGKTYERVLVEQK